MYWMTRSRYAGTYLIGIICEAVEEENSFCLKCSEQQLQVAKSWTSGNSGRRDVNHKPQHIIARDLRLRNNVKPLKSHTIKGNNADLSKLSTL